MDRHELTGARFVLDVERGRWDINSIKAFRRNVGKDYVMVARDDSVKKLPRKFKRARSELLVVHCDLGRLWRRLSRHPTDPCDSFQIWNNLF
jgi:hypothetical protein